MDQYLTALQLVVVFSRLFSRLFIRRTFMIAPRLNHFDSTRSFRPNNVLFMRFVHLFKHSPAEK